MAKVIDPLRSSEARGKVGGLQYNTWRGIRIVKTNTGHGAWNTPDWTNARDRLIAAAKQWQTITTAERAAWGDWAKRFARPQWTGTPYIMNGFQAFMSVHVQRRRYGYTTLITPPPEVPPDAPKGSTVTWLAGPALFRITWTVEGWFVAQRVELWRNGPHTAGRMPSIKESNYETYGVYTDGYLYYPPNGSGTYTFHLRIITPTNGLLSPYVQLTGVKP